MPVRNLGYACQNMTLCDVKPVAKRVFTDRTLRMDGFSLRRVNELALANVRDLLKVMWWNVENDIRFFRIGSGMFPFMDHPELNYKIDDLQSAHTIRGVLAGVGNVARDNNIRLSMHPGPYTCLASPIESVVEKSVMCVEMHSAIGDALGMGNDFPINIHVGGVYEDKGETAKRFIANFSRLSETARARLTLENDDKASMWTIKDLVPISEATGVPLVIDVHHHSLNHGDMDVLEAAQVAFQTWAKDRVPKIHYSEPRDNKNPQAHADYIENRIPELCAVREYDVMIEAKMKEKALLRYRNAYPNPANDREVRTCRAESTTIST